MTIITFIVITAILITITIPIIPITTTASTHLDITTARCMLASQTDLIARSLYKYFFRACLVVGRPEGGFPSVFVKDSKVGSCTKF